jgi:hypothetical protein
MGKTYRKTWRGGVKKPSFSWVRSSSWIQNHGKSKEETKNKKKKERHWKKHKRWKYNEIIKNQTAKTTGKWKEKKFVQDPLSSRGKGAHRILASSSWSSSRWKSGPRRKTSWMDYSDLLEEDYKINRRKETIIILSTWNSDHCLTLTVQGFINKKWGVHQQKQQCTVEEIRWLKNRVGT